MASLLAPMRIEDIGGGRVKRPFTSVVLCEEFGIAPRVTLHGPRHEIPRGTILSAEQLAAIPHVNRTTLIENHFIEVWPKAAGATAPSARAVPRETSGERIALSQGFGKWLVIEGRVLARDLSREAAEKLAGERSVAPVSSSPRRGKRTSGRRTKRREALQ